MPNLLSSSVFALSEPVGICSRDTTPSPFEEEVVRLYDELRQPVLRYLASLGIRPSDGEEIVQDAFFCLFQHLQRGKSRDNLRAWIFRVARNLALRQHRSRRRKPEELFGLDPAPGAEPVDPLPNPEEHTLSVYRRRRLLAALLSLPDLQQQTLHLRTEGLTYREIADVLGIPLTTLSRLVDRALTTLRRAYEG